MSGERVVEYLQELVGGEGVDVVALDCTHLIKAYRNALRFHVIYESLHDRAVAALMLRRQFLSLQRDTK